MTVNPMQRRTRNSFILGFGVAVLVALVIIVGLVVLMRNTRAQLKAEQAKQRQLLVASVDIKDSSIVSMENTTLENTLVSIDLEEVATIDDITSDGVTIISRNRIPRGTVITKSMLFKEEERDVHDLRLMELNMLMLPSELEKHDVVDIRLSLPTGQDFIVLTKKIVEKADEDSIWLKMTEADIVVFNFALAEGYLIEGAKMHVVPYVNPGVQKTAEQTYALSNEAWDLIKKDANITEKARNELTARHNKTVSLRSVINNAKTEAIKEGGLDRVISAVNEEISKMHQKREDYINQLTQIDY